MQKFPVISVVLLFAVLTVGTGAVFAQSTENPAAAGDAVDVAMKEREAKIAAVDKATVIRLEQIARGAKIKKTEALAAKAWAEILNIVPDHAEALKATTATNDVSRKEGADNKAEASVDDPVIVSVTKEDFKAIRDAMKLERDGKEVRPSSYELRNTVERKLMENADSLTESQYAGRIKISNAAGDLTYGHSLPGGNIVYSSDSVSFFNSTFAQFCAKSENEGVFARRLTMCTQLKHYEYRMTTIRRAIAIYVDENPDKFKTASEKIRFAKKLRNLVVSPRFQRMVDQYIADQQSE